MDLDLSDLSKLPFIVKAGNVRRVEQRAKIDLFLSIGMAAAEAGAEINPAMAVAPLIKNTDVMGSFMYECGLTKKQREELTFDDFLDEIDWPDLLMQFDRVIAGLFTFSPSLKKGKKNGEREEAETEKQDA